MSHSIVRVALASAAALSFVLTPSAHAVFPGQDGVIAYTGAYEERVETIKASGRHREKLLSNAIQPAWSPNGRRIAFVRGSDLYVAKASGRKTRRVTNLRGTVSDPAFSADGSHIAFSSDLAGSADIYVVALNGKRLRRVSDLASADTSPSWSVRNEIAFESRTGTGETIQRVDAAGATAPVSLGPGHDPSWSADGSTLIFVEGQNLLSTMDREGGARTPVSMNPIETGFLYDPTFSPSGTRIAVGRWSGSSAQRFGQLLRVDLVTGSSTALVTVDYVLGNFAPDWRAVRTSKGN